MPCIALPGHCMWGGCLKRLGWLQQRLLHLHLYLHLLHLPPTARCCPPAQVVEPCAFHVLITHYDLAMREKGRLRKVGGRRWCLAAHALLVPGAVCCWCLVQCAAGAWLHMHCWCLVQRAAGAHDLTPWQRLCHLTPSGSACAT
jgi:hypothetical protein